MEVRRKGEEGEREGGREGEEEEEGGRKVFYQSKDNPSDSFVPTDGPKQSKATKNECENTHHDQEDGNLGHCSACHDIKVLSTLNLTEHEGGGEGGGILLTDLYDNNRD